MRNRATIRSLNDKRNSGVGGEFLLGIFPPDHGGNHAPAPAPTPQAPPTK